MADTRSTGFVFRRFAATASLLVCLAATGCAGVPVAALNPLSAVWPARKAAAEPIEIDPAVTPVYNVSFVPAGKKPVSRMQPLTGDVFVQQVLDEHNALKKFRRCKVALISTSDTGKRFKMEIAVDGRKIPDHENYALRRNDHLMIFEDTETSVDRFVDSISVFRERE